MAAPMINAAMMAEGMQASWKGECSAAYPPLGMHRQEARPPLPGPYRSTQVDRYGGPVGETAASSAGGRRRGSRRGSPGREARGWGLAWGVWGEKRGKERGGSASDFSPKIPARVQMLPISPS